MSAQDYYNTGKPQDQPYVGGGAPPQGGYYPPPQGAPQGGYYPQQPQQAYQGGPPPQGGYYPQQGYQPQQPPQTIYVQQETKKDSGPSTGCLACLAGICLCCCADEICDCIF